MNISSFKLTFFLSVILSAFSNAPAAEPVCAVVSNGPTVWLPLDGNAQDIITGTQSLLSGSPAFVSGRVGQGLSFDRSDDSARIPASSALDIGAGSGATVEMWINPSDVNGQMAVVEWSQPDGAQLGLHIFTGVFGSGSLFANLIDTTPFRYSSWPNRSAAFFSSASIAARRFTIARSACRTRSSATSGVNRPSM